METTRWGWKRCRIHTIMPFGYGILAGMSRNPEMYYDCRADADSDTLDGISMSVHYGRIFAGETEGVKALTGRRWAPQYAALGGNLAFLKLCLMRDLRDTEVLRNAAATGQIAVLDWLIGTEGIWISRSAVAAEALKWALRFGQREAVEHLWRSYVSPEVVSVHLHSGYHFDYDTLVWASSRGYVAIEDLDNADDDRLKYFMSRAIRKGSLEAAKWGRDRGFPLPPQMCEEAAANGRLEVLRWLHEECKEKWDAYTANAAAANGHLPCLQYAVGAGCEWDEAVCHSAAIYGYSHVLRWARANGAPWRPHTRALAKERLDYTDDYPNKAGKTRPKKRSRKSE